MYRTFSVVAMATVRHRVFLEKIGSRRSRRLSARYCEKFRDKVSIIAECRANQIVVQYSCSNLHF